MSVNARLFDKPDNDVMAKFSATGWIAQQLTADGILDAVSRGYAIAPVYKGGHRKKENFVSAGFLAADCDGSMTLTEALDRPFINANAAFIYTTPSHTEATHRFRIVFLLSEPFSDGQKWADAALALAHRLGTDLTVAEPARCFFGSSKAHVRHIGNVMPDEIALELARVGAELRKAFKSKIPSRSPIAIDDKTSVRLATGEMALFTDLKPGVSIHCPYHDDKSPSAFVVQSKTGDLGIHCRACNTSFWGTPEEDYDFQAFDKVCDRSITDPAPRLNPIGLEEFFPPEAVCTDHSKRFLPFIIYQPGITLIKSPKGSGKTEYLKALINVIAENTYQHDIKHKDKPVSIILIGHRRVLLRSAASKIGLRFYRDADCPEIFPGLKTLAVCLDSLPSWNEPYHVGFGPGGVPLFRRDKPHDLVIIDESEQVLRHLLGETIARRQGGIKRAFDALTYEVANAKAVIALDADLGMLTTHALRYLRPQDWRSNTRIVRNVPAVVADSRVLQLYQREKALQEDMLAAINRGERCFIATNSRKSAQVLAEIIKRRVPSPVKLRVITGKNSNEADEIDFVQDITRKFLKIQVLICSPSLGTGIDITFPNGECLVDNVYGFFYPKVNTHTDMDQQLWRVRNPGAVKVWISDARFNYSSNFDVIRDELGRSYAVPSAVSGRGPDGQVTYNSADPLLMICTHITAAERASKSRLLELFCELREKQGWKIERIAEQRSPNSDRSEAERLIWNREVKALLAARSLDSDEYLDLAIRVKDGDPLSNSERYEYERARIELSLKVPLTYEICKLNHDGLLLKRTEALSSLLRGWSSNFKLAASLIEDQAMPLAKLPELNTGQLLACVGLTTGLADTSGWLRDADVTAGSLLPLANLCARNRVVLEMAVGRPLRSDLRSNPVRQLNDFLRLVGLKVERVSRSRKDGKVVRKYRFSDKFDLTVQMARAFEKLP